jgi:phage-related protein
LAVSDELLVSVKIDTKDGTVAVKDLAVSFKDLEKAAKDGGKSLEQSGKQGKDAGLRFTELNSVLELASKAYTALVGPINKVLSGFIDQEKAQTDLRNTLKGLGFDTRGALKDLVDFADELESLSGVEAETTLGLARMAKTMGLTNAETKRITEAAFGLSNVMGMDVNSAFNDLIGQLNGATGRSAKFVAGLKDLNQEQLKTGEGIELVYKQFAQFASLSGGSLAGNIKIAQEAFNSILDEIGQIIVEFIDLPNLVRESAKMFREIAKDVAAFGERLKILKQGLSEISFDEFISGIRALGIALTTAFVAVNFQAILAGFTAIRTALTATAIPAALVAAKFALITAAVVAFVVAVETVIANLDQLTVLGKAIELAFLTMVSRVIQGFTFIATAGLSAVESILEPLSKFSTVADSALQKVREGMVSLTRSSDESQESIDLLNESLNDTGKDLKIGSTLSFILKGVDAVKNVFGDLNKESDDLNNTFEDIARRSQQSLQLSKEQLQTIQQLKTENEAILTETANMNASQFDIIERQLALELKKIDAKREQLILEGKISKEALKLLEEQASAQKAKSEAQINQIGKVDIIPQGTIDALRASVSDGAADLASGISSAFNAFAGAATAIMGAVNGVLDFAQQVIDFIPQVLGKIANIFNSITELPGKIVEGFKNVFTAVTRFIQEFIPNLIAGIEDLVNGLVDFLIEGLPAAFESLLARLPDIIVGLIDRLPELIERFVTGFIDSMPRITIALINGLVEGAPKIALSMIKVFVVEIPKAIIRGILEGAKQLEKRLRNFFTGVKLPKEITDLPKELDKNIKNLGRGIAKESSKLFKVLDLDQAAKAEDRFRQLEDITEMSIEKIKSLWQSFIDGLVAIWRYIYETFLKPFIDALTAVWRYIWENILKPFLDVLWAVWNRIYTGIILPIINAFKETWGLLKNFVENAWSNIINFFQNLFKGKIEEAFSGILKSLSTAGKQIWDGFKYGLESAGNLFTSMGTKIWNGLKSGLDGLSKFFSDMFNKLNPANLFEKIFRIDYKGKDTVEKALNIDIPFANFATGGMVPGKPVTNGDSLLNDRVLALLSPGEAIIPRSAMQSPEIASIVQAILNGRLRVPQFAFGGIGKAIGGAVSGAKDLGGTISDVGKNVGGGISGTVKDIGGQASELGKQALKEIGLDLNAAWRMVQERTFAMVMQMFRENAFANGGIVSGSGLGDTVPAMLTPGEYVMNRNAVNSLGQNFMNQVNKGNVPNGQPIYNVDMKVSIEASSQSLDESFIRNRLIPSIKDEFRRASIRGEFLMSPKGLRTT